MEQTQYSGPTTTANSTQEGRMKVDAGKKEKIIKKVVKKYNGKGGCDGKGGAASDIINWGAGKLKNIGSSVSSAIKKLRTKEDINPTPPPGAMYEWDEKKKTWVGNNKYRRMMELVGSKGRNTTKNK